MRIILLFLVSTIFSTGLAQIKDPSSEKYFTEIQQLANEKYGTDQQLINGSYYEYRQDRDEGHPFLFENKFSNADLIFREIEYKGIIAKYDVYNQSLILKSDLENYQITTLLAIEFVTEFSFSGMLFRKYSFNGEAPAYFQVVSDEDEIVCLYYWHKTRIESIHQRIYSSFKYSESKHKNYLLINEQIGQFRNNRSFVKLFPMNIQRDILSYLKSEKLRVKKVTDAEMSGIIQFSKPLLLK
ncbi:MAG: hypothetical protein KAS71_14355 [Bacteroidales bacterium]|nr:hypothetical protein [Bacteroidales bacterium]